MRVGRDHDGPLSRKHAGRQECAYSVDQEPVVLIELDDVIAVVEGTVGDSCACTSIWISFKCRGVPD